MYEHVPLAGGSDERVGGEEPARLVLDVGDVMSAARAALVSYHGDQVVEDVGGSTEGRRVD